MLGKYSDLDNHCFLGKLIKLPGSSKHYEPDHISKDFIKVKVSHLIGNDNPQTAELIGIILQESSYSDAYQSGDLIAFRKEEIMEVCSEGIC